MQVASPALRLDAALTRGSRPAAVLRLGHHCFISDLLSAAGPSLLGIRCIHKPSADSIPTGGALAHLAGRARL